MADATTTQPASMVPRSVIHSDVVVMIPRPQSRNSLSRSGCFKKEGITFFDTAISNSFQCYLSECLVYVCGVSISIVCVSWEEVTLIESNQ